MVETSKPAAGPPPDVTRLHEAALAHLARYATTQTGLIRVLERRVERWARAADADAEMRNTARAAVRIVVARLAASGLVDDVAFAQSRARSLTRAGRSRRAVAAHLAARGIAGDTLRDALPSDGDAELSAAVACARRRRIGPFRTDASAPPDLRRELGMLARAGFAQDLAPRVLRMDLAAAEDLIIRLRQS
jgi:regulatory protein